jgi:hypothetical protein
VAEGQREAVERAQQAPVAVELGGIEAHGQLGLQRVLAREVVADLRRDLGRVGLRVDPALVEPGAVEGNEERGVAALREQAAGGVAPDRHVRRPRVLHEAQGPAARPAQRCEVGVCPAHVVLLGGEAHGLARRRRGEALVAPGARELSRHPRVRGLADGEVIRADQH